MLRFVLSYRLLVLLSGLTCLSFQNTCGGRPTRSICHRRLFTRALMSGSQLVWGSYHLCNPLYYRTIESVVLHLRAKTCRVNRTSHSNNSSLPVETYLPWINCWIVIILLLNLSNASNLLYTGLRSNLTLLTILSFRFLLLLTPFWFFLNAVLGCDLAAIWRVRDVSIFRYATC